MQAIRLARTFLITLLLFSGAANAAGFTAGAGQADIQIPQGLYALGEFVGQHDPLATRVVLFDDGHQRAAIVVVDLTSLSGDTIASIKTILQKTDGVLPDNVIVCASHTFSAPHVFPPEHTPPNLRPVAASLEAAIEAAVLTAARQAASLQPATFGFGQGISRLGVNRDVLTPHGWWLGANDAGYADPTLAVLRLNRHDGTPLAILMNMAVQPSIMDQSQLAAGGRLVSSDLAGAMVRYVEGRYPGTVSSFLIGAAGDQSPYLQANRHVTNPDGSVTRVDAHEAGFLLTDLFGARAGGEVVRVAQDIHATQKPAITVWRKTVEVTSQSFTPENAPKGPVTSYSYRAGDKVNVPVVMMRIGDTVLVGLQAELAASVGAQIRAGSPFAHTVVLTMVDGAAKYMPAADSYDRFTYEARSSFYARGSAEIVSAGIVDFLKQMHGAAAQP